MKFSANQAAEKTGKHVTTIIRAIKSGKLSADKNEDGSYSIDTSELFRVYSEKDSAAPAMLKSATEQETPRNTQAMDILREFADTQTARVAQLEIKLQEAEKRLDQERADAKEERENARAEREQIRLYLPPPAKEVDIGRELITTPEQQTQAPRRRWFSWRKEKA